MYRILHVYPMLNCGGTEMVFYNIIKFSDKDKFQHEILVQQEGTHEKLFAELKCQIHKIPFIEKTQYKKELAKLFDKNKYQAVHCHMHEEMPYVLEVAKEHGVPHTIAHSHNARIDVPKFLWPLRFFKHHKYERNVSDYFGCSTLALKWLFPLHWKEGKVIYNGIDLDSFWFNDDARKEYRKRLGVKDSTRVIINVGRCDGQKNQSFILDCAKELKDKDVLFVIIGFGDLQEYLTNRIEKEKITNVLMLGTQLNVPNWLCAADVFMFPSVYEGLGIVAIEAQASGLPVIATDTIPEEADIKQGLFHRIPLSDKASWMKRIMDDSILVKNRRAKSKAAFDSQYNIKVVTEFVESIYLN